MQQHMIVGIDPGATVGVALVGLSGRKIAAGSFSGGGISEAIRFIERHGTPSLVACDVQPPPEMAQKLASYFSCRLHSPSANVREQDKRQIAQGANLSNNHERDAYSAAVLAFREYANKLRQIDSLDTVVRRSERLVDKSNDASFDCVEGFSDAEKERVKHLILRGYRVKDAFLSVRAGKEEQTQVQENRGEREIQPPQPREEILSRLSSLARENANLRMLAEKLEGEKEQLENRVRLLDNGARQSMMRDSEIRSLRFQLQKYREIFSKKGGKGLRNYERKRRSAQLQHEGKGQAGQQKQQQKPEFYGERSKEAALYSLGEPKIDLKKVVEEYRKGRK